MSHFTTIAVQIENGDILQEALKELGYKVEQNAMVRGYKGNKTKSDYVIRQTNGYDLGFRKVGASYELVADFWGARIDQQAFIGAVTQKYAHKALLVKAQEQGFAIERSETLPDGTVRVVMGRWV